MEKIVAVFVLVTTLGLLNFNRVDVQQVNSGDNDFKSGEIAEIKKPDAKQDESQQEIKPDENQEELKTMNNDFDILKQMPQDKNYMVSPFSLKMAMMLAGNGANGQTQSEILKAFNIQDIDKFNETAKALIQRYNSNNDVKLNVANSIWLNSTLAGESVKFSNAYENLVKEYFDGVSIVEDEDSISRKANDWIEEKTNGKIEKVLDEGRKADFLSLLINTIYFKGEWADQFDSYETSKDTFTDRNLKENTIDFMRKTRKYSYYEDSNMKMVKLPYRGNEFAMYFVIPENREGMDISNAINNMKEYKVKVEIPKFKTEYGMSFKDLLKQNGINVAFNGALADFNKMFDNKNLVNNIFIDDVLQKAFIEVNETGTEAAAATVIIAKNTSLLIEPEEIKEFKANKPFIYFILDENTKEVLFLGEYAYVK